MVLSPRYNDDNKAVTSLDGTQKEGIRLFREKDYQMIDSTNCVACKGSEFEILSEKDRYGLPYRVVICTKCGLVFANPYFTDESLVRFYNEDSPKIYRKLSKLNPEKQQEEYFEKKVASKAVSVYDFLNKHLKPIKDLTIVEVGCASGGILQYFKQHGNKVHGVDYGSDYITYGKSKGLDLHVGNIDVLIDKKIRADVVIYADVLEHIPNITIELEKAKQILKDDGVLYIALPSIKKPTDFLGQLQNAHVWYFVLPTLTNLMTQNGYELVYGDEQIQAIYKKSDGVAPQQISNEYEDIMQHLRQAEQDRNKILNRLKRAVHQVRFHCLRGLSAIKQAVVGSS